MMDDVLGMVTLCLHASLTFVLNPRPSFPSTSIRGMSFEILCWILAISTADGSGAVAAIVCHP